VRKRYHPPLTPCQRLLASVSVAETVKQRLREQFAALDPVALLQSIRVAQQKLVVLSERGSQSGSSPVQSQYLTAFATVWHADYRSPRGRRKTRVKRSWRTRPDPFVESWPLIESWLTSEPNLTAKALLARLASQLPDLYPTGAQLRTLQRRVKSWRSAWARQLVFAASSAFDSRLLP
jgi:hypothetical protein